MEFELKAAKAKWEREQREKVEKARARLERERKARDEAKRQQEALEESQRLRRIEATEAAVAAEQQEREDIQLGDGVRYNRILKAIRLQADGDKIHLSTEDFEALSSQGALDKGPIYFEISVASSSGEGSEQRVTHGGSLQFTAPEGYVGIPTDLWRNARLGEGDEIPVRVRYVRLPKGKYAKLQPQGLDFADVPNHKAVLETKLRHHATLSEDDILVVRYGGMEYELRVLELKPASAISVLETDIEVDVVAVADQSAVRKKLVQLTLGKSETGAVEEGEYRYYKFNVDSHLAEAINRGDLEVGIRLQVDGGSSQSDADIYVAAHPVVFPSRDEHQWASHETGTKAITLTSLLPGVYSIAVYGFHGSSSFKLDVEARQRQEKAYGQKLGAGSSEEGIIQEGYETCSNCHQLIPIRTMTLHELYCRRHNLACQHPGCGVVLRKDEFDQHVHCAHCGQAFQKDELQKHTDVFHVPRACSCGAVLQMQEMVKHKATSCPHRVITCRFCGDMVQAGGDAVDARDSLRGLSQHESSCGSRTDKCNTCQRAVMLKDMDLHMAAVHSGAAITGGINIAKFTEEAIVNTPSDVECPVCSRKFQGMEAVNLHVETEHLQESSSPQAPTSSAPTNFRQSLSVLCPICGMAVHSERDLSSHIDMVH